MHVYKDVKMSKFLSGGRSLEEPYKFKGRGTYPKKLNIFLNLRMWPKIFET
jgi:hypothetical protein